MRLGVCVCVRVRVCVLVCVCSCVRAASNNVKSAGDSPNRICFNMLLNVILRILRRSFRRQPASWWSPPPDPHKPSHNWIPIGCTVNQYDQCTVHKTFGPVHPVSNIRHRINLIQKLHFIAFVITKKILYTRSYIQK